MPDLAINSAAALTGANLATGDSIPVYDTSATAGSKGSKMTPAELATGLRRLGSVVTDPGIAYFRSDGNNTTGDGSPQRPYAASGGQTAYTAGFKYYDIGPNLDIGTIIPTINNDELFFRGAGKTSMVYVQAPGKNITIWDICGISCYIAVETTSALGLASGNIVIHYGYLFSANASGGNNGSPQNAGNITLFGPMAVASHVTASGSNYGEGEGDGSNAGTITIGYGVKFLPSATEISAVGGTDGTEGGNAGADGTVILRGCDTGTVVAEGAVTYIGAIENGVFIAM